MAIQSRQIVWIDAGGRTRVTLPSADPDNSAIMAALQGQSNAAVQSWFEGPPTILVPVAVSAAFPDVVDLARLTFTDAFGSLVNLALPAPKASIFMADSVTVDPAAIAAIITASIGHLVSSGGNPVTAFVAGLRNLRAAGS